jgi:hypothetical protein
VKLQQWPATKIFFESANTRFQRLSLIPQFTHRSLLRDHTARRPVIIEGSRMNRTTDNQNRQQESARKHDYSP